MNVQMSLTICGDPRTTVIREGVHLENIGKCMSITSPFTFRGEFEGMTNIHVSLSIYKMKFVGLINYKLQLNTWSRMDGGYILDRRFLNEPLAKGSEDA